MAKPIKDYFVHPVDVILAEIVIRIQLPPSKHRLAEERYCTLCEWISRKESPLYGLVEICYVQGSMAIGATIAARGRHEEYDIDAISALLFKQPIDPETALDLLFKAVHGEPGSRYHDMVERRTRCVTIYYEDRMHLDITPAVRKQNTTERTSDIFHNDPDKPQEPSMVLTMNAWGFCDWFKQQTKDNTGFAQSFGAYSRSVDAYYKADVEPVAPHEDPDAKSTDVLALQLIKRIRNTLYENREGRMPPSVMLSCMVGQAARPVSSIFEALRYHTKAIRDRLLAAERAGELFEIFNPTCDEDCFTDRWPCNRFAQRIFLDDMNQVVKMLDRLAQGDLSITDIQNVLAKLFGEAPTKAAVRAAQETVGESTRSGTTLHRVGSGLALGAGAIIPASAAVARASTNMGGIWRGRDN